MAPSGLTSARCAEMVGTSAPRLSTYASGKVRPSAAMLLRIERVGRECEEQRSKRPS